MGITTNQFDVIVIGGGHAGCEAALASSRMGLSTLMVAMSLDSIAMMPCNPSIGGTGKGHLVKEVDALGGEMGINIDKTYIQSKMLNIAKGPAVHSLRAQADKNQYHIEMKKVLENQPLLEILQDEVVQILADDTGVKSVTTATEQFFTCAAVILATGTYLKGKVFIGSYTEEVGPNGLKISKFLSNSLKNLGIELRRFKTGTPARIHADSLDYTQLGLHPGDEQAVPFSYMNDAIVKAQVPCYLTYTNLKTHEILKTNLSRSALYGGEIEGVGPRYCPSIEDKIVRFADKERHQLFIEPEGLDTKEMYVQGMSTSMPVDVQVSFLRTIAGLENMKLMRPAYAIEYDCIDPTQLTAALEFKTVSGLFSCGQFNGSSGYEEAAAQGIMAGINAALKIQGKDAFILDRSEAYIGVLIDDLVTKGTEEPYRMMTSRCEYRLLLRQDNADKRLTEKAYNIGLATVQRYEKMVQKYVKVDEELVRIGQVKVGLHVLNELQDQLGLSNASVGTTVFELIKRPEITYEMTSIFDEERPELLSAIKEQVEIQIKYDGYIKKQLQQVSRFKSNETKRIPLEIDYTTILGLRIEARQKLNRIKPQSIGQASRISGVSPADISVLMVHLEHLRRSR